MQTNIIERELNRLIEKLRDFGVDPATYLAAKVHELDAERLNDEEKQEDRRGYDSLTHLSKPIPSG